MSRPPVLAPRPLPKPGLFRQVPPMIFPPLLGALMVGLGWRAAAGAFGFPAGPGEALLGALVLLWAATHAAYVAKLVRRPAVLVEDLAILPGQFGLGAAVTTDYAVALALVPYAPGLARVLLCVALLLHALLMLAAVRAMRAGPGGARGVTPAWQMLFAGPMLAAAAAAALGWPGLARGLLLLTAPVVVAIWAVSLGQLAARVPPAPLRPLLALHPAQAAVTGLAALGLGWQTLAVAAAVAGAAMLLALLARQRWLLVSGYTALWGGAALAPAALALLFLRLPGMTLAGGILLALSTLVALPVLWRVMQDWTRGRLAATTNPAEA